MKTHWEPFFYDLSQTFFIGNAKTGLVLFLLFAAFAPQAALAGLVCGLITRSYGLSLKPNKLLVQTGLFGMNGFFLGVGMVSLFELNFLMPFWLGFGGLLTAIAIVFLHRFFLNWQFPILVLPYALILWLITSLKTSVPSLTSIVSNPAPYQGQSAIVLLGLSTLNSFSEIFFRSDPWLGAGLLLFLLATHRRLFCYGVLGAALSNLLAMGLRLPPHSIQSGYWGFSGLLVAIALGVGYRGIRPLEVVLGVLSSVPVLAALGAVLSPLGLFPLGLPYIFLVWIFLAVAPVQAKRESLDVTVPWRSSPVPLA